MERPLATTIIAFEQGELDDDGVVELFQHLVDTGLAWSFQGSYGRTAVDLIEQGLVHLPWECPECEATNLAAESTCRRCGREREGGRS